MRLKEFTADDVKNDSAKKGFNEQLKEALDRLKEEEEKINETIERCDFMAECSTKPGAPLGWFLETEFYENIAKWLRELLDYRNGRK